jgi:hypothetical protein
MCVAGGQGVAVLWSYWTDEVQVVLRRYLQSGH